MKTCAVLALFALFLVAGCTEDPEFIVTEALTSESPTPTSTQVTTTTESVPSASTTESAPPSTTLEPTTPNTTPTTPKTTPASTTPNTTPTTPPTTPKTTPSTTPKTTLAPTTQAPTTTTKSPDPPIPEIGSWNVTNGTLTCIRADLKLRFKIPVKGHDDYIALSPNATGDGSCDSFNNTQELIITDSEYGLVLTFEKESSDIYLKSIQFYYNLPENPGTVTVNNNTRLFGVKEGNAYLCNSLEDVPLDNVTMEIFHIHIQAYGKVGDTNFGAAEECEADNKVDDIVPIAVGCALLALVVVVLIAYFVGRRRNRQKGYQSV